MSVRYLLHLRNAVASKMSRMQIAQGATPSSRNVLIYIRVSTDVHAQNALSLTEREPALARP